MIDNSLTGCEPMSAEKNVFIFSSVDNGYVEAVAAQAPTPAWVGQAKEAVRDLFNPNPWLYWIDLTATLALAYGSAMVCILLLGTSPWWVLFYVITTFALFRAGTFAHELVHLRSNSMKSFRVGWDLAFGIPTLFPSFAYHHHLDHHRRDHYGTRSDGEYLPLGAGPPTQLLMCFLMLFVWPLLVLVRFLVLTPVSFLHPRLRQWVLERASSFGIINLTYRREIPASAPRRTWVAIDVACWIRATLMIGLVVVGATDWTRLVLFYFIAVGSLILSFIRVLGLHSYRGSGAEMSYMAQLEDSITLPGHPLLTELFFPLGLRYHALHHMFPGLPYHSLGIGHRRLMAVLPPDSPYVKSVAPSFWVVTRDLWRNAWSARQNSPSTATE